MKLVLKILFVVFIIWMIAGFSMLKMEHPKAQIVMGLGVLFMAFMLMPLFIYYRYKDGKYKKYIINDEKLNEAFKNIKNG